MTRVLILGYGSIGARHARLVRDLGATAVVVSQRDVDWPERYPTLDAALAAGSVDCVVIANETSLHWDSLRRVRALGFDGDVLIEKPLAAVVPDDTDLTVLRPERIRIAYNLRFHPALQRLKRALMGKRVIHVAAHAGQDLRTWRPGRVTSETYSASRERGGGALRDLSHELDYIAWLFGSWKALTARGGHFGPLAFDADDCWSIILAGEQCPVISIQLEYYHRPGVRNLSINTADDTIIVDLVRHTYTDTDGETSWSMERDMTYRAQLAAFLAGSTDESLCSFAAGLETVGTISALERAAATLTWIQR